MDPKKRLPPQRYSHECPSSERPHKKPKLEQSTLSQEKMRQLQVYFPMLQKIRRKESACMKELNLSHSNLKGVEFLQFLDNSRLIILNLNQNYLVSLRGLQRCNFLSLQILYIRYNFLKENEPFHLYQMPRIIQIFLNNNKIANLNIPKLMLPCPKLNFVQIGGNPVVRKKWKRSEKIKL